MSIAHYQTDADARRQDAGVSASLTVQGKCVEYKVHHHRTAVIGGKRGDITDFSDAARLRMMKNLFRIDLTKKPLPLFVTLTYPDEHATPDLDARNLHRKLFARDLEKLMGQNVAASWRVEWVERKSGLLTGLPCPHWHLLIFNIGFIPYQDINRLWAKTIGHEGYLRTEIRRVDEKGCVQGYMAKYISKDALPLSLVIAAYQSKLGRAYGWLRKADLPWHPITRENALSDALRDRLTAFASEKLCHVTEGLETGWTLLGDAGEECAREFPILPLTPPP